MATVMSKKDVNKLYVLLENIGKSLSQTSHHEIIVKLQFAHFKYGQTLREYGQLKVDHEKLKTQYKLARKQNGYLTSNLKLVGNNSEKLGLINHQL